MKYYLAYGSNLNLYQMKRRCPKAIPIGTSFIEGYELLFKGSKTGSYLTIEKCEGARVPVAVWKVEDSDELSLDAYEGYPTFYYKKEMEIIYQGLVSKKKRKVKAFVYIMHEDRQLGVPSNYYVDVCANGYTSFGFDFEYLKKAYMKSLGGNEDASNRK